MHVLYFEGLWNGKYRYFVFETDKLHNILLKSLRFQGDPSFSTNIKPLFMNSFETRKWTQMRGLITYGLLYESFIV